MTDFRDSIEHPDLRTLYDYWNERRRGRRWPSRADINPLELKFALGNLSLIDVSRTSPPRFTFRLVGTLFSQRIGQDLTGKTVDDIPDPVYRAEITKAYRRMIEAGEPSVSLGERDFDGEARRFETLRLPLSEDGQSINMVLICALYFDPPPATSVLGPRGESTFTAPKTIKKE
jgi:hypothetical protein